MTTPLRRSTVLAALTLMGWQAPVYAHHAMGGDLPRTFLQGLLSGLGHPVIGLDHLAAIVGIGALAGIASRGVAPIFAFSAAMMAGVALHVGRIDLPIGELLVGLSTFAIGALLITRVAMSPIVSTALFALAGIVHGHALGESIVGAEPTPIAAYLGGLFVVQTAIGLAAYALVRRFMLGRARTAALSAVGILVALIGGTVAAFAAGLAA